MIVLRKEMKELNKQYRETDRIYHEISMQSGLSDSAFMILSAIVELGEGCKQKDIADLHKGSRRDLHISLTTEGKRFVEEKIYPVMEMENSIFDELTEQESEEYLRLAKKITCLLREKMNHR